uniref:Troponin I2, fast skeletal type n=1 Tax=Steinernema glaseri TaxID=37863 RepID=A0A1I7YSY7_9BILA
MPYPSKRKVAARAKAQKASKKEQPTMDATKEQQEVKKALLEEKRQLLERLGQLEEERKRREEAETKAIVCNVLQFAKEHHGPNAVEWTSALVGVEIHTLREYEKELEEEGSVVPKLPPCLSAPKKSSR